MKSIQLLLCILLFLIICQCKKQAPPTDTFIVEVTSDANGIITPSGKIEVVSGNSLPLAIFSNFGYKIEKLIVNDFPVALTGNTSGTFNYTVSNIEKNSKVEVVRSKNLSWYISQNKWKADSLANLEPNGSWSRYLLWEVPGAIQLVYTFKPDGNYTIYNSGNFEGSGTWTITGEEAKSPVLNLKSNNGTILWKIEQLDGVYLTLFRDDVQYIGNPNFKFTSWRYKFSQLK